MSHISLCFRDWQYGGCSRSISVDVLLSHFGHFQNVGPGYLGSSRLRVGLLLFSAMSADITTSLGNDAACSSKSFDPQHLCALIRRGSAPNSDLFVLKRVLQTHVVHWTDRADLSGRADHRWTIFLEEDPRIFARHARRVTHPVWLCFRLRHHRASTIDGGTLISAECVSPSTTRRNRPTGLSSVILSFVRPSPTTDAVWPRR